MNPLASGEPQSGIDARAAAQNIRDAAGIDHIELAVTLGSGWKSAADLIGDTVAEFDASTVPGFRAAAVLGHSGLLRVLRTAAGAHVLVIGARTHLYEGHGVAPVVHGVRTAAALGASVMVITNGAGGLNPEWSPGTPVLISDHLNFTAHSPILGAEFTDLTEAYSPRLRGVAQTIRPDFEEGVYAQLPGPHYETPAEVRMLRTVGADLVGMSTALETIAARRAGLEVLGVSLVTNSAAGIQDSPLDHSEVLEAGRAAEAELGPLLAKIIALILSSPQDRETK